MEDKVTVCILTYNSETMIARCVESVLAQTYPSVDLRILDNCSSDGTVSQLCSRFPQVQVRVMHDNLGFARAHNIAIRESSAPYYLPLNPDVILSPDYIEAMVREMERSERVGSVAGKLLFMDENGCPNGLIYSTGHLVTKSRSPTNRGYKRKDIGQYEQPDEVFAANGAAPLYRRAMLEDVALNGEYFCEDFFIYGEDHDLGWRAHLRGWQCRYTPFAVGYHVGYGSGGIHSFRIAVQFTRNRYLTLARNDRLFDFLRDLPFVLIFEVIWQGVYIFRSPRRLLAHWVGLYQALRALPIEMVARKSILRGRIASPESIRAFFVNQLW